MPKAKEPAARPGKKEARDVEKQTKKIAKAQKGKGKNRDER